MLRFVASIMIARLLTPAEVGVFALSWSASYFLIALREAGVGQYLVREPDLDDGKIRSAFAVMIAASWLSGLILLALREPAARLYAEPGMVPVLGLVAVTFFLAPFGQPALSLLIREMRFDLIYRISFLSALIGTLTSILLAFLGFSYFALAWGLIAATALTSALALLYEPRHVRLTPSLSHWREVLWFGGWVTAVSVAGTAQAEARKLVLGGFQGPPAVALFERAALLPFTARQALFAPLGRVLLPTYSSAIRAGRPIATSVLKVISATTVIIWPAFLSIGILAVPIVVTLFGENWRVAGEILPYILFAQALLAALPQPEGILISSGHVARLFLLRLCGALVGTMLAVIGAAVSLELFAHLLPLSAFLFVVMNYFAISRVCGLSMHKLAPHYGKALLIAAVSVVPAVVVRFLSDGNVSLSGLTVVAVTTPLFWFGALAFLRHDLMRELLALPFFPSSFLCRVFKSSFDIGKE